MSTKDTKNEKVPPPPSRGRVRERVECSSEVYLLQLLPALFAKQDKDNK